MKKTDLIQKLKQLDGLTPDERATLIDLVNTKKKYGLVWEDKPEEVEEQLRDNLPVLKEVKEKAILNGDENPNHILIEGDNLHALTALTFTHEGRIDIIYIDPPYNTGSSDWKYNNDYVDSFDSYRHSKWIAMMNRRLKIAKRLLKEDGILILAIDDNEFSTISLLLDEIFPSKSKNVVVVVNNPHGVAKSGFSRCHEYAIFLLNRGQTINKKPAPVDVRNINLRRSGNNSLREDSPTMFYPIYVNKDSLKFIGVGEIPPKDFHPKSGIIDLGDKFEIWPIDNKGVEKNWYYSLKRVKENGEKELNIRMVKSQIVISFHHSNNGEQVYKSFWSSSDYDAGAYGATIVKEITKSNFPFPKSLYTVIDCLKAVTKNKKEIILDFFAGSGTTMHAVMQMNIEDGGNRQAILATNNENNICEEVTYERNKRVIKGYTNSKGENVAGFTNNNLRYYKSEFVGRETSVKNKKEITRLATELLCIKENVYTEQNAIGNYQLNATYVRFFQQGDLYLLVIYDEEVIEQVVEVIQNVVEQSKDAKPQFKVYVFSNGQYPYTEEFEDVLEYVTLCALPDAIYKAYQNVLPKRQRKVVPELEEPTAEEVETLLNEETANEI